MPRTVELHLVKIKMEMETASSTERRADLPGSSEKQQIFTIEALRGLAALSVAWFHLTNTYSLDWVRYSGFYGGHGVTAFFVISGFIIPYSLHRSDYETAYFPRFMLRRLVRLEPPYLVSIVLALILWELGSRTPGFAGAAPTYSFGQVIAHFFYLIPLTDHPWLVIVYWTLAFEFAFYVSMGLLWPLLSRRHLIFTAVLAAGIQAIDSTFCSDSSGIALLFFLGICCARRLFRLDAPWLSLVASVSTVAALFWLTPPAIAIVALLTAALIAFVDIPRMRVLAFLGAISYSLYLLHVLIGGRVVNIGRRFIDGSLQELLLSLVALGASLLAAALFWKYIEEPARRASKWVTWRKSSSAIARKWTSS